MAIPINLQQHQRVFQIFTRGYSKYNYAKLTISMVMYNIIIIWETIIIVNLVPTPSQAPQVVWLGQGKADSPSTGRAGRSGDAECLGEPRRAGEGQVFSRKTRGKWGVMMLLYGCMASF